MSKLLKMMFEMPRWEKLIDKAELKGIDKGDLRRYCTPEVRAQIYLGIKNNEMEFAPAHMAQIPKDTPGEYRTVFIGENLDRIIQTLINDCLFELFPEMIHSSCKSYQAGIGTGKVVKELSKVLSNNKSEIVGVKSDFHHYFDVVKKESVMHIFDVIEDKLGYERGTEPVMNLLRRSWNNDLLFDLDGNLIYQWCGIRQGNAIGSFLADTILYELDEFMSNKYKFYCRYSDDCITIHDNPEEVISDMNSIIAKYGVTLNPKKVEILRKDRWFKFLGFNMKDSYITLSKQRVRSFQKEISARSTKNKNITPTKALNNINKYLYKGDGTYSWATSVLPVINVQKDIDELNEYVMDSIRACTTGKKKIGGLGVVVDRDDYTIIRGVGRNVKSNKIKTCKEIEGFKSLRCMQNILLTNKATYDTVVRAM